MMHKTSEESIFATWFVIVFLAVCFLLFSFFAYTIIGDTGQPTWDYGTIKDVPAKSPYAVYKKLPNPQHVKGQKRERSQ